VYIRIIKKGSMTKVSMKKGHVDGKS